MRKILSRLVSLVVSLILRELKISPRDLRDVLASQVAWRPTTIATELHGRGVRSSSDFVGANMQNALMFDNPSQLRNYAKNQLSARLPDSRKRVITALEFGVWKGETIRQWAEVVEPGIVVGFDSFLGLSEDWAGTEMGRGTFSMGGSPPAVPKNVGLIEGWVEDTLPKFLKSSSLVDVKFVHLDLDTYAPSFFCAH